jgi:hypothetical protein
MIVSRHVSPALALIFAAGVAVSPTTASAGFFDQFFGGGASSQPSQPTYDFGSQPQNGAPGGVGTQPRLRKKVVHREVAPVRQKTTDLLHDKTLRPGDAIMMKDGVHIYSGPETAKHTTKQFVPIASARYLPSHEKAALVALDTTQVSPTNISDGGNTLASGRSAAVGTPISDGFRITDARGASIRYVGP